PLNFFEVWLSPVLGFEPKQGRVRVLGSGENPLSWISFHDVARFSAAAAVDPAFAGQVLPLGGPDALSMSQIVKMLQECGAPAIVEEHIPEPVLEQRKLDAPDSLQEAFAGIMLNAARGHIIDPSRQLELLPGRLRNVRDY